MQSDYVPQHVIDYQNVFDKMRRTRSDMSNLLKAKPNNYKRNVYKKINIIVECLREQQQIRRRFI